MDESIVFHDAHTHRLAGIMTVPPLWGGAGVVLCHGFNSHKNATTYRTLAARLAQYGIATLRFDFFGHGESEGAFEDITITEAKENVMSALQIMRTRGMTRLGLFGSSFGGWASLLAAAVTPDLTALALKSPVSDYWEKERLTGKEIAGWKREGFRLRPTRDGSTQRVKYRFYEEAIAHSVYPMAHAVQCPTLIVHGTADESVPFAQSEKIAALIPHCRLEEVPGADHGYTRAADFELMVNRVAEFFRAHRG